MSETTGQLLRSTREAKGQTLDDVERVTRIRAHHLAALEADSYGSLPSATHARGFLRNYAEHLGLDPVDVLRGYDEAGASHSRLPITRAAAARRAPANPPGGQSIRRTTPGSFQGKPPRVRSRRPRLLSADVLVATLVTIVLAALLVWGGQQLAVGVASPGTATSSFVIGLLTPTLAGPTATAGPLPEPTSTLALPTAAASYSGVNVTLRAELRSWVSVKEDGIEVFAGLMAPGETRDYVAQNVVELVTGNGKGTRVIFNGADQGTLGELGEVVNRLWTVQGMLYPTPTPIP